MSPRPSGPETRLDGPGSGPGPGPHPGSRPGSSATNTAKLRRAHRKSRNGCWECKRRHIKCDETRPKCSNCSVSERDCSFPHSTSASAPTPAATPTPNQASATTPAATSVNSPCRSPADSTSSSGALYPAPQNLLPSSLYAPRGIPVVDDATPPTLPSFNEFFAGSPSSSLPDSLPQPSFTAKHLVLFHHAQTSMVYTTYFMSPAINIALEWAQEAPYAMDQVLALAADHLALQWPENANAHRRDATELQTRALMWFNRDTQDIANQDNDRIVIPRFLFASLLSIHIIYETFAYYRGSYHAFIDRFIECTHLHRGVRTVISDSYELIVETSLRPFIINVRLASESGYAGSECAELERLIDNSDLAPATIAACKSACQSVQWAFNLHANLPSDDHIHAVTALPVLLTAEYVDALRKHRPEALLVLAYYGVLVHRCRNSWIVGDAGAAVIRLIADYLGTFWAEPLRWPLEVLSTEQG
ncbi:hypothetical protein AK830_g11875 [Neonectria ditissima]|uniref:Zn(2)-C6 fungal-type domain-containing protein n=1 Tax=Neonectria ditissima TaxID=78410 RepID=A0A0P7B6R2_9HYPO|nr:hypothetical protein AK830_g11875 [Neonectria ditissima]